MHGRMDPQIEFPPTVINPPAELRHGRLNRDVHRCQRGLAAFGLDPVIEFLERARGARNGDDVMRVG